MFCISVELKTFLVLLIPTIFGFIGVAPVLIIILFASIFSWWSPKLIEITLLDLKLALPVIICTPLSFTRL